MTQPRARCYHISGWRSYDLRSRNRAKALQLPGQIGLVSGAAVIRAATRYMITAPRAAVSSRFRVAILCRRADESTSFAMAVSGSWWCVSFRIRREIQDPREPPPIPRQGAAGMQVAGRKMRLGERVRGALVSAGSCPGRPAESRKRELPIEHGHNGPPSGEASYRRLRPLKSPWTSRLPHPDPRVRPTATPGRWRDGADPPACAVRGGSTRDTDPRIAAWVFPSSNAP